MLQGRLFSCGDAQRYRLGVNHAQIPVNAPRCPMHSFHRDSAMRVDGNYGSTKGYEPNSLGEWQEQAERSEPPLNLQGAADHWDYREDDDDYYTQPGGLFRLMTPAQQQLLFENTARSVGGAEVRGTEAAYRQLHEGRRRLWGGCGKGPGDFFGRGGLRHRRWQLGVNSCPWKPDLSK